MPEDVGGTPFPDGWEPDDDHDHGVSDEEFASVVFDEAFIQAATVHEPTAVERLLAAAQARAEASEAEARRSHARGERYDDAYGPEGTDFGQDPDDELEDTYVLGDRHLGGYGKQVRWHRPVAWVLAVVMGIGMVALAFAAVYRGGSAGTATGSPHPPPPAWNRAAPPRPPSPPTPPSRMASAIPRTP